MPPASATCFLARSPASPPRQAPTTRLSDSGPDRRPTGSGNSFFGRMAGGNFTGTGNNNTFVGHNADFDVSSAPGSNNTLLGANSKIDMTGFGQDLSFATAIGAGAAVQFSDMVMIGKAAGTYDGVCATRRYRQNGGHLPAGVRVHPEAVRCVSITAFHSAHPASATRRRSGATWEDSMSPCASTRSPSSGKTTDDDDIGFGAEDVANRRAAANVQQRKR